MSSIAVFDSGVGGLTVFRELCRHLPHEDFIYLGDSARLPYGNKSPETIRRFTQECADFLLQKQIKLLVVACHTASAVALETIELPIPAIGVVQAGIDLIVQTTKNKRIAILGTPSTIQSGIYQERLQQVLPDAKLFPIACPLFVPLAEEQFFDHPATLAIAKHYLEPLQNMQIDTVLLACTHYPLLKNSIQKILGPSVTVIEPASRCAIQVQKLLSQMNQLNDSSHKPIYRFFVTDHSARFGDLAQVFLGRPLDPILICLETERKP